MNKQKFLNILQSHVLTDNDDVVSLQKVAKQHPYSQIIHILLAKHYTETKNAQAKKSIQTAAIYATDRIVLKKIIESKYAQKTTTATKVNQKSVENKTNNIKSQSKHFKNTTPVVTDIDQLRNDVFKHLEELQESKKPFTEKENKPKKKAVKVAKTKAKSVVKTKSSVKKKITPKTSKKTTKKASTLSQKEQVDLIEKFIKSPPKIKKAKTKADPEINQEDLSKISAKFEEDFASENLAQILIKQGNKDKAIEIYKKLIWKFPQKKAYFATQIEGLKK